jgi:hypothetical protein
MEQIESMEKHGSRSLDNLIESAIFEKKFVSEQISSTFYK